MSSYPTTFRGDPNYYYMPFYHEKCPNCGYCFYCGRKDQPFKDHWYPTSYPTVTGLAGNYKNDDFKVQYDLLKQSLNGTPGYIQETNHLQPQATNPSSTCTLTPKPTAYVTNDSNLHQRMY